MFEEKRRRKWFCENVGRHIRSRYPVGAKSAVRNMFEYEMMPNVDMFRARSNGRISSKHTSALIIRKKWKRTRNRKRIQSEKKTNPKGFFHGMSHRIILSLRRG